MVDSMTMMRFSRFFSWSSKILLFLSFHLILQIANGSHESNQMRPQNMMRFELTHEFEVAGASADEIWAVYGAKNFPILIQKLVPGVFERIDILKGNGGVGTVLGLVFPPGWVPRTYKEKFVTVDDRRRLKEVVQIEGGFLDMGVTYYYDSFQIIEKGCDSCIIKSVTRYDVKDEIADTITPLVGFTGHVKMARAVTKYVLEQKNNKAAHDAKKHGRHGHPHAPCRPRAV